MRLLITLAFSLFAAQGSKAAANTVPLLQAWQDAQSAITQSAEKADAEPAESDDKGFPIKLQILHTNGVTPIADSENPEQRLQAAKIVSTLAQEDRDFRLLTDSLNKLIMQPGPFRDELSSIGQTHSVDSAHFTLRIRERVAGPPRPSHFAYGRTVSLTLRLHMNEDHPTSRINNEFNRGVTIIFQSGRADGYASEVRALPKRAAEKLESFQGEFLRWAASTREKSPSSNRYPSYSDRRRDHIKRGSSFPSSR